MRLSGALLCGGRSSRMGRDKAFIEVNEQPLWRLQLEKLRQVCDDVVICANQTQRTAFECKDARFEPDAAGDLGPLSGIVRALESTHASHVMVLGVDMPKMSELYLRKLWRFSREFCGAVPAHAGFFEGLCAVYPVSILPLAFGLLSGKDRSLQRLIREGLKSRLMRSVPVADLENGLFENWNVPEDVVPLP